MSDLLELAGMHRSEDHHTSIGAAVKVKRVTLREIVIEIALNMGASGITDDDLKAMHPETPESSLRKRRTELSQENILLDTGRTRLNRKASEEKVWVHRDFHHNPPPITERPKTVSKSEQILRLKSWISDLEDMVALAIPYVEEAQDDPAYSGSGKERIGILCRRMKRAVHSNGEEREPQS